MASVTRDSALYAQIYTNKYLTENAYQLGGRAYPIAFQHTVVSGEAGGASAGVSDIVNLCVLPKDVMVVALDVASENIWASVGVTGTYSIGDSGQVDRYMKATKSYTAGPVGGPIATQGDLRAEDALADRDVAGAFERDDRKQRELRVLHVDAEAVARNAQILGVQQRVSITGPGIHLQFEVGLEVEKARHAKGGGPHVQRSPNLQHQAH